MGRPRLHRRLLALGHREAWSPISSALAEALWRPSDDDATVIAVWWIALKFEEIYPPELRWMVNKLRLWPRSSWPSVRRIVRAAEADVLTRVAFRIPRHTFGHVFLECVGASSSHTRLVEEFLHIILYSRVAHLYDAVDWAASVRAYLIEGRRCDVAIQLVRYVSRVITPLNGDLRLYGP